MGCLRLLALVWVAPVPAKPAPQPPPNDLRAKAELLKQLPATLVGTTVGAPCWRNCITPALPLSVKVSSVPIRLNDETCASSAVYISASEPGGAPRRRSLMAEGDLHPVAGKEAEQAVFGDCPQGNDAVGLAPDDPLP